MTGIPDVLTIECASGVGILQLYNDVLTVALGDNNVFAVLIVLIDSVLNIARRIQNAPLRAAL